ncbi:MAG: hypothetical protein DMF99_13635 [Acidobacteria bacterium]|nr:MAG: hypothetical protein DMF99_13635 [Acidobacteriota bacterium]
MHVLGIDAGGTKTVCLLADERGMIVSEGRGPGANLLAAGELGVEKVLHEVMETAIGDRAITPAAICLGIAGVDREDEARTVRAIMRRIGYKSRVLVVNDALIALVAGAQDAPGIVIIAGTGSIVYGRNAAGEAARAGAGHAARRRHPGALRRRRRIAAAPNRVRPRSATDERGGARTNRGTRGGARRRRGDEDPRARRRRARARSRVRRLAAEHARRSVHVLPRRRHLPRRALAQPRAAAPPRGSGAARAGADPR